MVSSNIFHAINLCIAKGIPFAAYQLPNDDNITFFSNPTFSSNKNNKAFLIGFFGDKTSDPIAIYNECDALETINLDFNKIPTLQLPQISPFKESTEYSTYTNSFKLIKQHLERSMGKVVLSRVTCGIHNITDWSDTINTYFSKFINTFRYIYYTPQTGGWIGASPEALILKDSNDQKYRTISLAGTRKMSIDNFQWDKKNIEEHDFVTKYIVDTLNEIGCEVEVSQYVNIPFGQIEHLGNHINIIDSNGYKPIELVKILSPTPALSGYPVGDSLDILSKVEHHPRHCYGGYVAIDDCNFYSYVNLRCAHFDSNTFCLYSGGGITLESSLEDEWLETENKIVELKKLFI